MDFRFTPKEEALRNEIDEFLKEALPQGWVEQNHYWPGGYGTIPELEEASPIVQEFRKRLAQRGWRLIAWPKEYGGRGYSFIEQAIVFERLSYYKAPCIDAATSIVAPTIMHFGSEEMKKQWIPKIANENVRFWLAYSEPNAGSDLSSMQTRAVADRDDLIINGQKTWATGAHVSDYGWMAARTDWSVPPHEGITLFIVDNKTSGVTICPIINIAGIHSFNEVFFDNARVPRQNIVGEINKGWYYLMVALSFERLAVSIGTFRREFENLAWYAKTTNRDGQVISSCPIVRMKLVELATEIEIAYLLFFQTAWMLDHNSFSETIASALKLFASQLSQKLARSAMEIVGQYGQLERGSEHAPMQGNICTGYLDAISATIGAGTSEIQRNIIAQRGLGLPEQ